MSWEVFWIAVGSLFTGAAVVFAIYQWSVTQKEEERKEQQQRFLKDMYDREDRQDAQVKSFLGKIEELRGVVANLDKTVMLQAERYKNMTERFTEYVKQMNERIRDQDHKIEELGKIIRVGLKDG